MTIKQQGGIFGRNPTFNNLDVDGLANFNDTVRISKSSGTLLELYDADGGQDASTFSVTNGGRDMTIFAPQDTIFTQDGLETARFLNGGGLTFNGDTAAANALSDYEEGSWSPTLNAYAGTPTVSGYYVKIGQMVYVECSIALDGTSDSSVYIIKGLPFNIASPSLGGGAINTNDGATTDVLVGSNSTDGFRLRDSSNANQTYNSIGVSSTITVNAQYRAA